MHSEAAYICAYCLLPVCVWQVGFKGFQIPLEKHGVSVPFSYEGKDYTLKHGVLLTVHTMTVYAV